MERIKNNELVRTLALLPFIVGGIAVAETAQEAGLPAVQPALFVEEPAVIPEEVPMPQYAAARL
jgi:hypothetical protein